MKRTLFGLVASVAMMGTFIAAQDPQPPSPGQSSAPAPREQARPAEPSSSMKTSDTTITGCLVQGSSPNVFLLQDAKVAETGITSSASGYSSSSSSASSSASKMANGAASAASERLAYRLETGAGTRDADFKTNLNHQVSITGTAEPRSSSSSMSASASSASQKIDDKMLPKLTAKSVLKLADTCSVAG
jgi:hypothetical protein